MNGEIQVLFVRRPQSAFMQMRKVQADCEFDVDRNCEDEWKLPRPSRRPRADLDALTGLPTLEHVRQLAGSLLESARCGGRVLALVSLHLNEFQRLSEEMGSVFCDAILRQIGALLCAEVDHCGVVARSGPDAFLIVLHDLLDAADAANPVRRILQAIALPRMLEGQVVCTAVTAGIAVFPADGDDFETLLNQSSVLSRDNRLERRGAVRFHSSEMDLLAKQRWRLEAGLRKAVQRHELMVHYQPQFELRNGRVCGVEALARWFLADGSAVGPSVFIPVAERTGLIEELGAWVLELACATVSGWRDPEQPPPLLCFKVSTQQTNAEFCGMIGEVIARSGFPVEQLELEITERALAADPEAAIDCLTQWKQLGVRIAVDHFGVGYSSLSYLTRLPVDRLKLDRSLTHSLTFDRKSTAVVRSIVSLAKDLGVGVLAEGVETERQLEVVRALGCEQAQGYLFTQPAPAREARALLTKMWGRRPLPTPGCGAATGAR